MSLLTICQNVADEVGFSSPASIINNEDQLAQQLLRFANRAGKELAKHPWEILVKEDTITLVTSDQDYALATDFSYILPSTTWNRDNKRQVVNPITSQQWQFLKAWTSIQGLNLRARIRNNQLEFEQTIGASENGETIAYEYVSTYWVTSSGGSSADQESFLADGDTSVIDEELLTQAVLWRFKKIKGFDDWQQDKIDYELYKRKLMSQDGGARIVNLGDTRFYSGLGVNLPEQDFTL